MGTKLVTENIVKLSPSGSKAARGGRYMYRDWSMKEDTDFAPYSKYNNKK